jgi:hypothetical protein
MSYALLLAVGAVAIVAVKLGTNAMRSQKAARLRDRAPLSDVEFYQQYYEDSGLDRDSVARVRSDVAAALELPPQFLRPSDRFDRELAPASGWAGWDDGLTVLQRAGVKGVPRGKIDWSRVQTLGDLVRQACS